MAKNLTYNEETRKKIQAGVDKIANAVKATLGPKGMHVVLEKMWGSPTITNDGVTIAKEIELEDKDENIAAQLVREASAKTNDDAGDGTTTACVLTQAIITEGFKNIAAGANPVHMARGISRAVKDVVEHIKAMAKPVKTNEEVRQIATVSANNPEIGGLIAEAMNKVGKDGVITVEEGKGAETTIEVVDGMQIDRGYISHFFVTDPERMVCILDNPLILVTSEPINSARIAIPLINKITANDDPFLVVAPEVDGQALATMVVNKMRGTIKCCAVKCPGFGDGRKLLTEDLAILTGATVITRETGMKIEDATIEVLGKCKRAIINKEDCTIVGGEGDQKLIKKRIASLKTQINEVESDFDKVKLQERLAKLVGGVAVISVGGSTETEMKTRKFKVEDAMHATRAGIEEGIVPGGGVCLLKCVDKVNIGTANRDEEIGVKLVIEAIKQPIREILLNAGIEPGVAISDITRGKNANIGVNADTGEYVDMIKAGIIDPAKVVRTALENASSIAIGLLTTRVLVTDIPNPADDIAMGKHLRPPASAGRTY